MKRRELLSTAGTATLISSGCLRFTESDSRGTPSSDINPGENTPTQSPEATNNSQEEPSSSNLELTKVWTRNDILGKSECGSNKNGTYLGGDGEVTRLDSTNGETIWNFSTDSSDYMPKFVFTNTGLLTQDSSTVRKLKYSSGDNEFTTKINSGTGSPILQISNQLVLCGWGGSVARAVDVSSGNVVWKIQDQFQKALYAAGAASGSVFLGTANNMYRCNASSGKDLAQISNLPPVAIHVYKDSLVLVGFSTVKSLSIKDYSKRWDVDRMADIKDTKQIQQDLLIVTSTEVLRLNLQNGEILWRSSIPATPSDSFDVNKSIVWLGLLNGSILALDAETGKRRLQKSLSDNSIRWVKSIDDNILTTDGSTVYGFKF
jgi:outer membrane protein assembly factor BamB